MASEDTVLHTDFTGLEHSTRGTLCPSPEPPRWTYFHKPIIAIVMGGLMSGVGVVLFLLHSLGVTETAHATTPACLSIGLMFVVVGLVWVPILKEKLRRTGLGACRARGGSGGSV